jgi:hypothetical protein
MKVADIGSFAPLEPGTYFMDPDLDPSTSLESCTRWQPMAGRSGLGRSREPVLDISE